MSYRIKPLEKHDASLFTTYMGSLDFGHAPEWSTCYCVFYQTPCDEKTWIERTGETNRLTAIGKIESGFMRGFLAYDGDKIVGWVNANDATALTRISSLVKPIAGEKRVAATMCYVIHPEYRGKGVARELLKAAIAYYRNEGFDAMIAMPFSSENAQKKYRGSVNMYLENGYQLIEKHGETSVLWLDLKEA